MKKGIHPENYHPVVFKDMSNGNISCLVQLVLLKTVKFEGETYPCVKLKFQAAHTRSTLVNLNW